MGRCSGQRVARAGPSFERAGEVGLAGSSGTAGSPVVKTHAAVQGAWVRPQVWELKSPQAVMHGQKKEKIKINKSRELRAEGKR